MELTSTLIALLGLVVLVAALIYPLQPGEETSCRTRKPNPTDPTQE
ncbi:hypothetical protein [Propionivibrio sp.]